MKSLLLRGTAAVLAAVAFSVASPTPAVAESPTMRLTRAIEPSVASGRVHPFTDTRGRIPFLVELPEDQDPRELGLVWVTPPMNDGDASKQRTRIASGRFDPLQLFWFADEHPEARISVTPGIQPQLELGRKRSGVVSFRQTVPEGTGEGEGVVVGVVDTGIDLTHPAFLDEDGHTRVAWLLTWGTPTGKHPELEEKFGCDDPDQDSCAIYDAEEIDAMLAAAADGDPLPPDVHDQVGHGTHVASIAAGNGERGNGKNPLNVGMAPKATIVFAAPSKSGGFGDDEVLLGTSFIFDRADEMGMPAVVNLSLGGDYGPHDGTSLLEKGAASFVGDGIPGHAVVVAAGNSGALYEVGDLEPLGIHTEVHVEDHAPARVPIYVPEAAGGDVFVWVTFRPGDEVSVRLEGPDGDEWIGYVDPGDEAGYESDTVTAAVINNLVNDHSTITSETNSAVIAFHGDWEADSTFALELEGTGDAQLWVTGQGSAVQGAYFVQATKEGTINQPASHPRLMAVGCTINRVNWLSLEGAIELQDFGNGELDLDGACYFSAAGPTPLGVPKPEIAAPGAFVAAAMGADADPRDGESMFSGSGCPNDSECYVVDDRYGISTGTSMSSPFVAGAVALMFEQRARLIEDDPSKEQLTQAQVTQVLQASARKPVGVVPYGSQIGAGALDISHALEVLSNEPEDGPAPALSKSWWYLSSESVRPDPSWVVTGTIQLRREDGAIASGLDGSELQIEIDGGTLVRPAAKVTHGLFQFGIAGRRGEGGGAMTVRVLYGGKQLGDAVTIPIAIDEWAANGAPTSAGGLSCSASTQPGASSFGWVALLGAGLITAARKRRLAAPPRRG